MNQHGHWVCWMSTSRKNGLMWRTHTLCSPAIVWARSSTSIPAPGIYMLTLMPRACRNPHALEVGLTSNPSFCMADAVFGMYIYIFGTSIRYMYTLFVVSCVTFSIINNRTKFQQSFLGSWVFLRFDATSTYMLVYLSVCRLHLQNRPYTCLGKLPSSTTDAQALVDVLCS